MLVPPSFYFTGNQEKAISLKSKALKFYQFVTTQAELGGVAFINRSLPLEDGSLIKVSSFKEGNYNLRTGHIIIFGGAISNPVVPPRLYVIFKSYPDLIDTIVAHPNQLIQHAVDSKYGGQNYDQKHLYDYAYSGYWTNTKYIDAVSWFGFESFLVNGIDIYKGNKSFFKTLAYNRVGPGKAGRYEIPLAISYRNNRFCLIIADVAVGSTSAIGGTYSIKAVIHKVTGVGALNTLITEIETTHTLKDLSANPAGYLPNLARISGNGSKVVLTYNNTNLSIYDFNDTFTSYSTSDIDLNPSSLPGYSIDLIRQSGARILLKYTENYVVHYSEIVDQSINNITLTNWVDHYYYLDTSAILTGATITLNGNVSFTLPALPYDYDYSGAVFTETYDGINLLISNGTTTVIVDTTSTTTLKTQTLNYNVAHPTPFIFYKVSVIAI